MERLASPTGGELTVALAARGVALPPEHRLQTLAERPDLDDAISVHNGSVWPPFMLQDPVADRLWGHLHQELAGFQLLLMGPDDAIVATGNCAPLTWDGTDAGLPAGWDDQFERTVADVAAGRPLDTLGALQIVVAPGRQSGGLSSLMVQAFRALAGLQGRRARIACVRPTWKDRYPLTPIERFARWTRPDGLPFDPWIRVHVRLGGRIVRGVPDSMRIEGTVADWEAWTGMAFPETGSYVVPRAADVVRIHRDADRGVYLDPNVWVVHDLGG
jgi:hypothetical protein